MKVLSVLGHPEPRSFGAALAATAEQVLTGAGHEVVTSDLYRMGWQAAVGPADFAERADPDFLNVPREQEHAVAAGTLPAVVRAEQDKVTEADLVLFHFPIWWYSMPAIMKGWVDRVFARGFAYGAGRKYDSGPFRGKRAMLAVTTGTAGTLYEPHGIDGDLHSVLWPIHNGILAYTGFTVLPPFAAWMPGGVPAEERGRYLEGYAERLRRLDEAEPLFFHPRSDYDETQRLLPGVKARTGVQWNPRAGQTREDAARDFWGPGA